MKKHLPLLALGGLVAWALINKAKTAVQPAALQGLHVRDPSMAGVGCEGNALGCTPSMVAALAGIGCDVSGLGCDNLSGNNSSDHDAGGDDEPTYVAGLGFSLKKAVSKITKPISKVLAPVTAPLAKVVDKIVAPLPKPLQKIAKVAISASIAPAIGPMAGPATPIFMKDIASGGANISNPLSHIFGGGGSSGGSNGPLIPAGATVQVAPPPTIYEDANGNIITQDQYNQLIAQANMSQYGTPDYTLNSGGDASSTAMNAVDASQLDSSDYDLTSYDDGSNYFDQSQDFSGSGYGSTGPNYTDPASLTADQLQQGLVTGDGYDTVPDYDTLMAQNAQGVDTLQTSDAVLADQYSPYGVDQSTFVGYGVPYGPQPASVPYGFDSSNGYQYASVAAPAYANGYNDPGSYGSDVDDSGYSDFPDNYVRWDGGDALGDLYDRRTNRSMYIVNRSPGKKPVATPIKADGKGNLYAWKGTQRHFLGCVDGLCGVEGLGFELFGRTYGQLRNNVDTTAKDIASKISPSAATYKYVKQSHPALFHKYRKTQVKAAPYELIAGGTALSVVTLGTGSAAGAVAIAAGAAELAAQGYHDYEQHKAPVDSPLSTEYDPAGLQRDADQQAIDEAALQSAGDSAVASDRSATQNADMTTGDTDDDSLLTIGEQLLFS